MFIHNSCFLYFSVSLVFRSVLLFDALRFRNAPQKKKPGKGSKKRVLKSLPRASIADDLKAASGRERARSSDQEEEQVEEVLCNSVF